jgi:YidC/Oxa1 family membrane protein insertase
LADGPKAFTFVTHGARVATILCRSVVRINNLTEALTMDIPRYALIAASVLLGLMLLGEWTRFSSELQKPQMPVAMVETAVPEIGSFLGNDSAASPTQAASSDLPTTEDIAPALADPDLGAPSTSTGSVVRVETDVLLVIIDLVGGDVVGAALKDYPKTLGNPSDPFVLLERNGNRTYIAQSGLVGRDGIDRAERAAYRSEETHYQLNNGEPLEVTLRYAGDGPTAVRKIFSFEPGSHTITVHHEVHNVSASEALITPFAQLKRDGSPAPTSSDSGMGMRPFLGSALTHPDHRFEKFDFEEMADAPFKADLEGGWVAMLQHYFVSAWVPDPNGTYRYRTRHTGNGFNIIGYTGPALSLAPDDRITISNQLYVGPKNQGVLSSLAPHLDLVVDYGWLWVDCSAPVLVADLHPVNGHELGAWQSLFLRSSSSWLFFSYLLRVTKSMARMRKVQPRILAIRVRLRKR